MRKPLKTNVIVASLVAAIALVACGGGSSADKPQAGGPGANGPSGENSEANVTNSSLQVSTAEGVAPEGATTITFWQQKYEDYQQEWFGKKVKEFNASQSKVYVQYIVVPGEVWDQKLKAAQAANVQPDVATMSYGKIPPAVANGQLAPLDELISADKWADIKDNVSSFVQVDGKHYAYPILVEPSTVLYYRTDLVKAAGLDPASPPKTWDELETWAEKLTTDSVKGFTIASVANELAWSSWGLQYNACGAWPIAKDWSKAEANTECMQKVANFYAAFYSKNLMPQQPKVSYTDSQPYIDGEVAMMANGSWGIGQLKLDGQKVLPNTAVAAFPSIDGDTSKPTATLGGWTLTLDLKSKHPKESAEFISWLLAEDPQRMAEFFAASQYSKYTVRKSVDQALAKIPEATSDPYMKIISE